MTINWITIRVNNLETSREFYREFLGMREEREFSPYESMTIAFFGTDNGTEIELIYDKSKKEEESLHNNVSIGFATENYEDILREARLRGIVTVEPTILGGSMECFFVQDPNGVGIQIIKA